MADNRSFKFVYGDTKTITYDRNQTVESLLSYTIYFYIFYFYN